MNDFEPINSLERTLVDAQEGRSDVQTLMLQLLKCELYVPTAHDLTADGKNFAPLVFEREGVSYVAVFTAFERSRALPDVRYCVRMSCARFVNYIPHEFGVVINPSWPVGMEIPAAGVQQLRRFVKEQDLS